MRADRTIGIQDRNRNLEDRLKGPSDIEALAIPADEHRHRLEFARCLARLLGRRDARGLSRDGGLTRRRDGIKPWLQLRLGGGPLRL